MRYFRSGSLPLGDSFVFALIRCCRSCGSSQFVVSPPDPITYLELYSFVAFRKFWRTGPVAGSLSGQTLFRY